VCREGVMGRGTKRGVAPPGAGKGPAAFTPQARTTHSRPPPAAANETNRRTQDDSSAYSGYKHRQVQRCRKERRCVGW